MLIVKPKIREAAELDGKYFNIASDFESALDDKVKQVIRKACERARENGRNTVMPRDL